MSGENLATNLETDHKENNLNSSISNRVNINNLMTKVREQEKKEKFVLKNHAGRKIGRISLTMK